jgi:uncharacterized protein YyaL (SSP411 family)
MQQVVVVEGTAAPLVDRSLERLLAYRYLPFAIQLRLPAARSSRVRTALPFVSAMAAVDGRTTVYVCRDRACRAPATTIADLEGALAS